MGVLVLVALLIVGLAAFARSERAAAFCLASAVLVAGLTLVCHSPRYVHFRGLAVDGAPTPEVVRAVDSLRQLERPFVKVDNATNRVIMWRLLFPLVGHTLSLSSPVYLALPALGCLIVLVYVARIALRDTGRRRAAFVTTLLVANTSWFLVSTGWLAYFDSWCILALLVAAFERSTRSLVLTCLLGPWVDERFLLALPLALLIRSARGTDARRCVLVALAAVAPYLAIRAIAFWVDDPTTAAYLDDRRKENLLELVPPLRWLNGAWNGPRLLWPFLIALPWLAPRQARAAHIGIVAASCVLLVFMFRIAGDLSRSAALLVPVGVLGALLAGRHRRGRFSLLVAACLALVLPAQHVVWVFEMRIRGLPSQIEAWHSPPRFLDPVFYVHLSKGLQAQGKIEEAAVCLERALALSSSEWEQRRGIELELELLRRPPH